MKPDLSHLKRNEDGSYQIPLVDGQSGRIAASHSTSHTRMMAAGPCPLPEGVAHEVLFSLREPWVSWEGWSECWKTLRRIIQFRITGLEEGWSYE